ncbi:putative fimbrial protein TcfA [Pragia fontium]|uniref:hypothetical protein n=1 Tax=Pragia fontium TaxID=82985 RepID=UPI000E041BFA|nr:hypothetical protein [Pragia fontium]SUB81334.1 putative fimbrial protein TcfA [Pragia fontium]
MSRFNFKQFFIVIGMGIVGMTSFTLPAIEVIPIIKQIKMDTPRDNYITIKSSFPASEGKEQYEFVSLDLFHVTNPGEAKENFEKELSKPSPTLLFSPTKVVIPYGASKKIRIMALKPVEKEQIYRLRVRPTYPEDAIDPGKVRFAIGYDVLVRYLPNGSLTQELKVSCSGGNYQLEAMGNSRVEMRKVMADGNKVEDTNVYPNQMRKIKAKRELTFEVENKPYRYVACALKE